MPIRNILLYAALVSRTILLFRVTIKSIRAISTIFFKKKTIIPLFTVGSNSLDSLVDVNGTHFGLGHQHGLKHLLEASARLKLNLGQQIHLNKNMIKFLQKTKKQQIHCVCGCKRREAAEGTPWTWCTKPGSTRPPSCQHPIFLFEFRKQIEKKKKNLEGSVELGHISVDLRGGRRGGCYVSGKRRNQQKKKHVIQQQNEKAKKNSESKKLRLVTYKRYREPNSKQESKKEEKKKKQKRKNFE
jgi:hypothetical protein